jgi:hypothetical protein
VILPPLASGLCWICRVRAADTGEHRLKASDIRVLAPGISQNNPVYLQRGRATNDRIGSAKADKLKHPKSMCSVCNGSLTQPYDMAWDRLHEYLRSTWELTVEREWFDMSVPFPQKLRQGTLDVHLFFVKLFGCLAYEADIPIDLDPFSDALLSRSPHPEIYLTVSHDDVGEGIVVAQDSAVHRWDDRRSGQLAALSWMYAVPPIAIKLHYIRAGEKMEVAGWPWHPSETRMTVHLSHPVSQDPKLPPGRRLLPSGGSHSLS